MTDTLYRRAGAALRARIAAGEWKPGAPLPTEPSLAAELGVSQGTLRRALASLEQERVIERRQGVGTFVTEATSERALFHFFRAERPDGSRPVPTSRVLSLHRRRAAAAERAALDLPSGVPVIAMERERLVDGRVALLERVILPAPVFEGFRIALGVELREELYVLYQREFGVTITAVEEWLSAAPVPDGAPADLGPGPHLHIARVARDLRGRPVEHRLSWMDTRRLRWRVSLG